MFLVMIVLKITLVSIDKLGRNQVEAWFRVKQRDPDTCGAAPQREPPYLVTDNFVKHKKVSNGKIWFRYVIGTLLR